MPRFTCANCNRVSYATPQTYHGRQYGPNCYKTLMEWVNHIAARVGAVARNCPTCGYEFIAPPGETACLACTPGMRWFRPKVLTDGSVNVLSTVNIRKIRSR